MKKLIVAVTISMLAAAAHSAMPRNPNWILVGNTKTGGNVYIDANNVHELTSVVRTGAVRNEKLKNVESLMVNCDSGEINDALAPRVVWVDILPGSIGHAMATSLCALKPTTHSSPQSR